MHRGDKTPDDLDRPDGNDLEANYEKHDVGEAEAVSRLEEAGFTVEEWGIDRRSDDGSEGILYDDKMDFKVRDDDGNLLGLLDVKTKSGPSYMGRFNARHYDHYADHADEFGVPTFVAMFQVDADDGTIEDEFVVDVATAEMHRSGSSDAVDSFPDGNEAVLVPHRHRDTWSMLEFDLRLESARHGDSLGSCWDPTEQFGGAEQR